MKKMLLQLTFCLLITSFGSVQLAEASKAPGKSEPMKVELRGKTDEPVGTVYLDKSKGGLIVTVEVSNAGEGWHGFHVHERGDCSNKEDFSSAGGHAMMHDHEHHGIHSGNRHMGDLPNIWAFASGEGKAQFFTELSLEQLNDEDGSSFILHEGIDDYIEAASSGARMACGIIYPANSE